MTTVRKPVTSAAGLAELLKRAVFRGREELADTGHVSPATWKLADAILDQMIEAMPDDRRRP